MNRPFLLPAVMIAFATVATAAFMAGWRNGREPNITHRIAYRCGALDRQMQDHPDVQFTPILPSLRAVCDSYRQGVTP